MNNPIRLAGAALLTCAMAVACGPAPSAPPSVVSPSPHRVGSAPVTPGPDGSGVRTTDPAADWTLVRLGDDQAAEQFAAVVSVGDGFVLTGSRGQAAEIPVALHSVDGATWTKESIQSRFGGPSGLLAWGDRVVGIGGHETGRECAHPDAMDTWVRAADAIWTEAPFDPVFCDNGGTLVAQGRRVWLAGAVRDTPSLMETTDGLTWTSRSQRLGGLYPRAAAVDGAGLRVFASDLAGGSVALLSRDGKAFERRPITITAGGPVDVLTAVVLDGETLLIVTSGDAVGVLRPAAAGGWHEAQVTGLPARNVASVLDLDGHLMALGSGDDGLPLAFTSADGTAWAPIRLPAEAGPGTTLNGVAMANGVVVLVGQTASPDGSGAVGAIWTGSASLLAP